MFSTIVSASTCATPFLETQFKFLSVFINDNDETDEITMLSAIDCGVFWFGTARLIYLERFQKPQEVIC